MTRKPEREQENQLTNQYVDPHRDLKKERPQVLIPSEEGNAVSLGGRQKVPSNTRRPWLIAHTDDEHATKSAAAWMRAVDTRSGNRWAG